MPGDRYIGKNVEQHAIFEVFMSTRDKATGAFFGGVKERKKANFAVGANFCDAKTESKGKLAS
jgi:hypothetical protein